MDHGPNIAELDELCVAVLQTDYPIGTPGCYMHKCDKKRTGKWLACYMLRAAGMHGLIERGSAKKVCAGFRVDSKLTFASVQSPTFGLKHAFKVDGQVYAQPLYAPGITVKGVRQNLLVIATMKNSIYVFNAGEPP